MASSLVYYLVAGSESTFPVDLTDIQHSFVRQIQRYFPDNAVKWISLREVREGLFNKLLEAQKEYPDAAVVTLSELYYPTAELEVSANRIISTVKQDLKLGPRPRSAALRQQVDAVMAKVGDRPVITVDDTLFHGDTLTQLIKLGMRVDAAVEYFTKVESVTQMASQDITVFPVFSEEDYVDVMPIHDFLPPLPLCGKVVGYVADDGPVPLVMNGLSFSVPYLLPWATPLEVFGWATIPEKSAREFSAFAIRQSIEVMNRLWGHGFSSLEHAVRYQPLRTSVPYLDGQEPDLKVGISVMLERCLHLVEQED